MSPIDLEDAPRTAADWQRLWRFTLDPYRTRRRPTREVRVGDVGIGGDNPIRVQSMTVADTLDTAAVVDEIIALHAAGSEIVRVTTPSRTSAENLQSIRAALQRRGVRVPLVADVHFTPQAAMVAALHVEKVRINPGNYADRKHFRQWEYTDAEYAGELERLEAALRPLVLRCKERGVAMRIGTNHGSLSDRILNRYGDTPLGMVESALEFVRICERHGYRDLVLSMKASDPRIMIGAYRLLSARMAECGMDYPFHIGVTEAGAGLAARVKSAVGIASLLADGIGDTVRVSLAEDSVHEIPVARALANAVRPESDAPSALAASAPAPPTWDPYRVGRRRIQALGEPPARLAVDVPPRVEIVRALPSRLAAERVPAWLDAILDSASPEDSPDIVLVRVAPDAGTEVLATLARCVWQRRDGVGIGIEVEQHDAMRIPAALWARVSIRVADPQATAPPATSAMQFVLGLGADDAAGTNLIAAATTLLTRIANGTWPFGALAVATTGGTTLPGIMRRILTASPSVAPPPLVLRAAGSGHDSALDASMTHGDLDLAVGFGALLADGIGDAVQFEVEADAARALRLGRELLQATRLRLTKADFIACPSCGRTQFDLQSTTARIETAFRHLKGLKIAIMGCIVNGPGEMADADFGYVGSGPGKVDLYVGREVVEGRVPESEAVERLAHLIRTHGRWVDP